MIKKINILLSIVVCVLIVLCVRSVYSPIHFEQQCAQREASVKQRLITIRSAAERYRHDHNAYTGQLRTLIDSSYMADSVQYIPYSGHRSFHLEASAVTTKSGHTVPVMECSTTYNEYLQGLDANSVRNMTIAADASGRFPGLKIGDLSTPNDNSGNWE